MRRWQRPLIRPLVSLTLVAGVTYVVWRWTSSVNWRFWWIAVPLVLAETYTFIDAVLFGLTMWRIKIRPEPPVPAPGATVDVLITTYDEPIELVLATARAAERIRHPHRTWILDDGDRTKLAAAAAELGVGYITRGPDWIERPRHAKAGNLNNALFETYSEFLLILDADQVPDPAILDRTLGWFDDSQVALVQTPQYFSNVTARDPLGSQAPLFYGPIQQGKDGWNAAFFCGSNAVIRREALMQLGVVGYVREIEEAIRDVLGAAEKILVKASRSLPREADSARTAVTRVKIAARSARVNLDSGVPVSEVTYGFQQAVAHASQTIVESDAAQIHADLGELTGLIDIEDEGGLPVIDEAALAALADREWSPLTALESVAQLVRSADIDRADEAMPVMPMATLSVTEDMATCMRLHALGWKAVYHHEVLARGLAPLDLTSMITQRLRWAQGTIQVLLKENPLVQRGLSWGQRLMYFGTMWSYLSGFTAVIFLLCPPLYLCFGVLPVSAVSGRFLAFFLPYFVLNQLLFFVVGYGIKTWRGQQYSLALFPVWIRACVTAAANVLFGRRLGFAVTSKAEADDRRRFPWLVLLPQLTAMAVLAAGLAVGLLRHFAGHQLSDAALAFNLVWSAYNLTVLSVIIEAGRYRAPARPEEVSP